MLLRSSIIGTVALIAVAVNAAAQVPSPPSCTTVTRSNISYQETQNNYLIDAATSIVDTTQPINGCGFMSEVQAVHIGKPGVHNSRSYPHAFVRFTDYYSFGQTAQADGYHYITWIGVAPFNVFWFDYGQTVSQVTLVVPQVAYYDNPDDCQYAGYVWNYYGHGCETPGSPIILDMSDNGILLSTPEDGVLFDLDADGVQEQTAWTREGTDDAWLAMDRDGNGKIDNGGELFGNHTMVDVGGGEMHPASDGFVALQFLERPEFGVSFPNNVVDERDAAYSRLLLWTDRNHNGLSEPEELTSAADGGLSAITSVGRLSKRRDQFGNDFKQKAPAIVNGQRMMAWDVWLRTYVPGAPTP
jgi:hypothetical protein